MKRKELLATARRTLRVLADRTVAAARGSHRFVRHFEPWGVVIAIVGLSMAVVSMLIDLEDQQSERVFRAWQVVAEFQVDEEQAGTTRRIQGRDDGRPQIGTFLREAVELLNREFEGFLCLPGVNRLSYQLTGSEDRECLFPKKRSEVLYGISLRDANLVAAHLPRANLNGANLSYASLGGANLTGSFLLGSDLSHADLANAQLRCATLSRAILRHSSLEGANLRRAFLVDAELQHANLGGAELIEAKLLGADLKGADLGRARLRDADLSGARLAETTNLSQRQLDQACGDRPMTLPPGLRWNSQLCLGQSAAGTPAGSCAEVRRQSPNF